MDKSTDLKSKSHLSPEELFELGKLHMDRVDFDSAIGYLQKASDEFLSQKNFAYFLKSQNHLLRMFAEREDSNQVQLIKERLQDLVLKEGFELNSKTYLTLAACAIYKGQCETSLDYVQKALALALANDDKEDTCYAISGLVANYIQIGKYEEGLKEIYNLEVFFQVMDVPELKAITKVHNGQILAMLKKYDQAIEVFWQAYEQVRKEKSLLAQLYLLTSLGWAHAEAGEKDLARVYLNLAKQICDPINLKSRYAYIQRELESLGEISSSGFDLVFELENHSVIEKRIGKIDFKNQFVLLDLLKVFVQNPGQVFSKEYLVEHVWKQPYDPAVHDNKIYVTIKRLRKMIEPDYEKPKYIFRAKNGYFLNKAAKVYYDQREL